MNKQQSSMKNRIKLGVLALILIYAPLSLVNAEGDVETAQQTYNILTIEPVSKSGEAPIGGTVIPYKEVTLTAQAPGRVEYIAGEEGDAFQIGQLLVTLDRNKLMAQRSAAIAQLQDAQVAANNARVQLMREIESPRSNSFSKAPGGMGMPAMFDQMFSKSMSDMMGYDYSANRTADFYQQQAMVQQAYNAISQAQAQIVQIDATLRDTQSLAPFNGQIYKKYIEIGDTVQPGQPLVTFSDNSYLQIKAEIPVKLASSLKAGQTLNASIESYKQPLQVTVARVFPGADEVNHTVTVKFNLPVAVKMPTGTYAEVNVPMQAGQMPSLPLIPASAVVVRSGLSMVFIVNENNETDLRVVRVGRKVGDKVKLLAGIKAGQRIIVNPSAGLVSGLKLKL